MFMTLCIRDKGINICPGRGGVLRTLWPSSYKELIKKWFCHMEIKDI